MGDVDSTAVSGVEVGGYRRGTLSTDTWDQYVIPRRDRIVSHVGRSATFLTPGRAAVGQKIHAIHNATGSSVLVAVNRIVVGHLNTAAKLSSVIPPIIRIHRFTAIPTNGTSLTKTANQLDSSTSSNASVTVWGDASADGTGSATTLTITIPTQSILDQRWTPYQVNTQVGGVTQLAVEFEFQPQEIILRALEGVCVFLDQATTTTGNPATDKWISTINWEEFTRP